MSFEDAGNGEISDIDPMLKKKALEEIHASGRLRASQDTPAQVLTRYISRAAVTLRAPARIAAQRADELDAMVILGTFNEIGVTEETVRQIIEDIKRKRGPRSVVH